MGQWAVGADGVRPGLPAKAAGKPGRAGLEIGSREGIAEESAPASRVTDETDYFRLADDTSTEIVVTIALFDSAILARIENMRLPRAAYQHWHQEAGR